MNNEMVIDSKTYKIMKYLYRKNEVKLSVLEKMFGEDEVTMLFYLCKNQYAAYRNLDKTLTFEPTAISSNGSIGLTPLGNKYVEGKRDAFLQWFAPILISCFSAAISLLAIAISIFSNNQEIFVHIIK